MFAGIMCEGMKAIRDHEKFIDQQIVNHPLIDDSLTTAWHRLRESSRENSEQTKRAEKLRNGFHSHWHTGHLQQALSSYRKEHAETMAEPIVFLFENPSSKPVAEYRYPFTTELVIRASLGTSREQQSDTIEFVLEWIESANKVLSEALKSYLFRCGCTGNELK